jgi:diacylglycerol kinase family enzyme
LVNNHFSINVSGVGFDAEVAKNFEKTSRGFSNYIKTTINTFFKYKPVSIVFQEKYQEYNGEYLMVNIANTRQFGNNAYIAPLASTTDGLVDVVLVKKMPFVETIPFALKMFNKTLKDNQYLTYISTKEVSFSVNSNTWHLDGEYKEIDSPVTIKVLPKSLKILI